MANLKVKNGDGTAVYLKTSGAGTDADPLVAEHAVTGPLTDDELRASAVTVALNHAVDVASLPAPETTTLNGILSTSGDNTLVVAPPSGEQIVLDELWLQLLAADATTVLVKHDTTTERRVYLAAEGDWVSWVFPMGKEIRLGDNEMLILNLSGNNQVSYLVRYRYEAV